MSLAYLEWTPVLPTLAELEAGGEVYFYGTPLVYSELEPQVMPKGRCVRALRPTIPVNADFHNKRFASDADMPVVCVTSRAKMAAFRALGHQSLHDNLPKHQRRHGWQYRNGEPVYFATAALLENIRRVGQLLIPFCSQVAIVRKTRAPFKQFDREPHQFRSEWPVIIHGFREVNAQDDWPTQVEECAPYPEDFDLSSFNPYRPELQEFLDDLLRDRELGTRTLEHLR